MPNFVPSTSAEDKTGETAAPISHALDPDPQTPLAQRYATSNQVAQSGFALVGSGSDAFAMRVAMIEQARHSLDLQYYLIHADDTGRYLIAKLIEAAHRGVRVRILVDDIYTVGHELKVTRLASHANIEVRVFNPFIGRDALFLRMLEFVVSSDRVNRRMHNKLFIADNTAVLFGGRNLGNEYFSSPANVSFVDLDVFAVGPIVRNISTSFDEYWNDKLAVPLDRLCRTPSAAAQSRALERLAAKAEAFSRSKNFHTLFQNPRFPEKLPRKGDLIWASSHAVWDSPHKAQPPANEEQDDHIAQVVQRIINDTQRELMLISPYFVPGEDGMTMLHDLHERGVSLSVLTNSLAATDVPAVHAGYARYRPAMLQQGLALFELRPLRRTPRLHKRFSFHLPHGSTASLHAKALVVDRCMVVIGSANADPRSRYLNTEFVVVIESAELAAQVAHAFARLSQPDISYRVTLQNGALQWTGLNDDGMTRATSDPEASPWRRCMAFIYRLIAPEKLL